MPKLSALSKYLTRTFRSSVKWVYPVTHDAASALTICDARPFFASSYPARHAAVRGRCGRWGVVVTGKSGTGAPFHIARALDIAGRIPADIDKVLCLPADGLELPLGFDRSSAPGCRIDVLYDDSGMLGAALVDAGDFSVASDPPKSMFVPRALFDAGAASHGMYSLPSIEYSGPVPDGLLRLRGALTADGAARRGHFALQLSYALEHGGLLSSTAPDDLRRLLHTLSFGELEIGADVFEDSPVDRRSCFPCRFRELEDRAFGLLSDRAGALAAAEGIARIWTDSLSAVGLGFADGEGTTSRMLDDDVAAVLDGVTGVRSRVHAFLGGVPMEDLLGA